MKKRKSNHEGYVGVRFESTPAKVYCYRVKDLRKVYLGQSLVVINDYGTSVVFVVQVSKTNPTGLTILKEINLRVAPL